MARQAGSSSRSVTGPLCLTTPSSVSQVRFSPSKRGIAALQPGARPGRSGRCGRSRRSRAICACSSSSPAWPNGGWPRSWASATVSARSASSPSARGERAGDLRHLQRVGQAGAEVVALVGHEDLGLLLQPPERRAVDDPVAVAGEGRAGAALGLRDACGRGSGRGPRRRGRGTCGHEPSLASWPTAARRTSYSAGTLTP